MHALSDNETVARKGSRNQRGTAERMILPPLMEIAAHLEKFGARYDPI